MDFQSLVKVNFNSICRLCMAEGETLTMPSFTEVKNCVGIEISNTDNLPQQICSGCEFYIRSWCQFKILSSNTDALMRKILSEAQLPETDFLKIKESAIDWKKKYYRILISCDEEKATNLLEKDAIPTSESILEPDNFTNDKKQHHESSDDENMSLSMHREKLKKEKRLKPEDPIEKVQLCWSDAFSENDDDADCSENKKTKTKGRTRKVRVPIPSTCKICEKTYKNSEILRQHMKSVHVAGVIECFKCQMKFKSLRSLKYHEQRNHSNLEAVPCSFCGKEFLDKKYLRIHENIHSQNNHYICQYCGRKFIMKNNLTVHIRRHHTQKSNDFMCQVCGKAFPFKLYLKKHIKTHTDIRPHACTQCTAKFRENTLLQKHINSIHLKLRPFSCQFCRKTFTRNVYLREHMETQHLRTRKWKCAKCEGLFQSRTLLKQHDCSRKDPAIL